MTLPYAWVYSDHQVGQDARLNGITAQLGTIAAALEVILLSLLTTLSLTEFHFSAVNESQVFTVVE
jgi:hypothetical protein